MSQSRVHVNGYRADIDGMRAIAILSVLAGHADVPGFSGGFLGVDLFFVLSGFLITGLIVRDLEQGQFSFAAFFERRARRILPALLLVIAVTLLLAPLFMWPWQVRELGTSAVTAAVGLSNIVFYNQTDYFAPAAETLPLLHTWSLAVEEQFYVFYPILLLVIWRVFRRRSALILAIACVTLASFLAAVVMAPTKADAVHFLTHYRAFEFGIGAIAVLTMQGAPAIPDRLTPFLGALGLWLIGVSVVFLDPASATPVAKLPLLAGVVLLLGLGHGRGPAMRLLTWAPMRWLGLISYSLYLWHQPVLAYGRLYWGEIPAFALSALIALCLVLAALTWRFVETPARRIGLPRLQVFRAAAMGVLVLIGAGSVFATFSDRVVTVAESDRDLAVHPMERGTYLWGDYVLSMKDRFASDGRSRVLLVGDSFSQDLFAMMNETLPEGAAEIVTHHILARCQPYLGPQDVSHHIKPGDRALCSDRIAMEPPKALLDEADLVVVAASWRPWSAAMMAEIAAPFQREGRALVFVGTKSFREGDHSLQLRAFRRMTALSKSKQRATPPAGKVELNRLMAMTRGDWAFVDMMALICGPDYACPLFTPEGALISHDGSHLTREGAAYLAPKVLADPAFRLLQGHSTAMADMDPR